MTGQWSDPGRIVVIKSKGERSTKIDCRTIWNPDNLAPNIWYYFFEHFLQYLKILFTDSFCQQFEIKHLTCQIVHFLILEPNCLFVSLVPNFPLFINLVPNCRIPNCPVPYCPTTLKILALFQDDDAETIKEAFKLFDRDQDGYITCKELIKVQ